MIWLYIVLAVAAIFGVISEAYMRLLPYVRQKQKVKREAKFEIQYVLDMAIPYVENYDGYNMGKLMEAAINVPISKRLRQELNKLIDLASEYNSWRYESFEVINAEVRAQSKHFDTLNRAFKDVIGNTLEKAFSRTEGSLGYDICKSICRAKLMFETAKESVLEGHWDAKVIIRDEKGEEKELMFKDLIEGKEFYEFIKILEKLESRKSVVALRKAQEKFLTRARLIVKEVA